MMPPSLRFKAIQAGVFSFVWDSQRGCLCYVLSHDKAIAKANELNLVRANRIELEDKTCSH